jgi:competence protein ComEC
MPWWLSILHGVTMLHKEYPRHMLWMPVLLGLGIHVYFLLPWEPPVLVLQILGGLIILLFIARWLLPEQRIILYALMLPCLGFSVSQLKTILIAAPRITKSLPPAQVTGVIHEIETTHYGYRLMLGVDTIEGLDPKSTPKQVTLILRRKELPVLHVGDHLKARVKLVPLQGPVFPGGFDFRKKAFFQQVGGQGFIFGDLVITPLDTKNWSLKINQMRQKLNKTLYSLLPGQTGAVATALITGEKTRIDRPLKEDFADAGIAHVLAISGLHLSLVAGLFFLLSRGILAPIAFIARRYNTKKIAAVLAFFGALGYLGISGASIPTQRAFIMFSLLMLAVLTDRLALSMRTIAIAASIVLLITPESLSTPSFQLSFAAVLGLISAYEFPAIQEFFQGQKGWRKPVFYMLGVLASTVIASIATLPFTIYHFHRFTLQSIAANLVTIPLMGFWIMPMALGGMLTSWLPTVSQWFLKGMGYGIDLMINTATTVAHWPGAAIYVPQTSPGFLYCIVVGGLWICLWQQKWRWLGLLPLAASLYFIGTAKAPDIYVSEDLKYVGIRYQDHMYVNTTRTKTFLSENWAHAAGMPTTAIGRWKDPKVPVNGTECEKMFHVEHFSIAHITTTDHLQDWCAKSDILLSTEPLREKRKLCHGPKLIIDRFDTWRHGSYAIRYNKDRKGFQYITAMDLIGHRPWSKAKFKK